MLASGLYIVGKFGLEKTNDLKDSIVYSGVTVPISGYFVGQNLCYNITTTNGYNIIGTSGISLHTYDPLSFEYSWISLNNLTTGNYIAVDLSYKTSPLALSVPDSFLLGFALSYQLAINNNLSGITINVGYHNYPFMYFMSGAPDVFLSGYGLTTGNYLYIPDIIRSGDKRSIADFLSGYWSVRISGDDASLYSPYIDNRILFQQFMNLWQINTYISGDFVLTFNERDGHRMSNLLVWDAPFSQFINNYYDTIYSITTGIYDTYGISGINEYTVNSLMIKTNA